MTTKREINKEITGVLSTNEIAAGCKTAMRGGGCQWGMAEEASYAAKWLAMRGLFCPSAFAEVAKTRKALSPPQSPEVLSPRRGFDMQCPVCLGAFLSDHLAAMTKGGAFADGKHLSMRNVLSPLLTAACLAQAIKTDMLVSWRGGGVLIRADKKQSAAVYGNAHQSFAPLVKLQNTNAETTKKTTKAKRITLQKTDTPSRILASDNNWKILMKWANKTTVASSQTSTIKGAGAGLTDND